MVDYRSVEHAKNNFVECLTGSGIIASERDALDLVAACGENHVQRLLLHAENLSPDFFNLKTGLAGAVLLKFTIYSIKLAAVLTPEQVNQGRFKEMAMEVNRSNQEFHIFLERDKAIDWLTA